MNQDEPGSDFERGKRSGCTGHSGWTLSFLALADPLPTGAPSPKGTKTQKSSFQSHAGPFYPVWSR